MPALLIQFGQHVVEQQDWLLGILFFQKPNFGHLPGNQNRFELALRGKNIGRLLVQEKS